MPAAGYTVGRDTKLVFVDPNNGGVLTWNVVNSIGLKQLTKQLTWTRLDGTNSYAEIPQGWDASLDVERAGPEVLDYFVATEAQYFNGASTSQVYLQQTITNPDGSVSQYRLTNGTLKLSDAGTYKGDDKVMLKVDGKFTRITKVS